MQTNGKMKLGKNFSVVKDEMSLFSFILFY